MGHQGVDGPVAATVGNVRCSDIYDDLDALRAAIPSEAFEAMNRALSGRGTEFLDI
jgi:hypothetical protein